MQGYNHFFPLNIHKGALTALSDVKFTPREVDVIACLIHLRGTRKISSLLSMSPNTVLSHIRNIMLKLECNSRESIIDFIEHSQALSMIKEHYNSLALYATFLQCLKDIKRTSIKKGKVPKRAHLILCGGSYEEQKILRLHLVDHLKLMGLNVDIEFITSKEKLNGIRTRDLSLLLCLEGAGALPQGIHELDSITLFDHPNYYLFVFALLNKLLPHVNLTTSIQNFVEQFRIIGAPCVPADSSEKKIIERDKIKIKIWKKKIKRVKEKKSVFFIIMIFILLGIQECQILKEQQDLKECRVYLEQAIQQLKTISQEMRENRGSHLMIPKSSAFEETIPKDLGEHWEAEKGHFLDEKKRIRMRKIAAPLKK